MHKDDMNRLACHVPSTVLIDLALEAVERIRTASKSAKSTLQLDQEMDHLESWLEQLQAREQQQNTEYVDPALEFAK